MLRAAVSVLPSALAPASHRRRATRQGKTDVVKVLPSRETTVCKAQGPSAANAIGAVLAATLLVAQPDPASAFLGFFEEPEPKNEYERMLKTLKSDKVTVSVDSFKKATGAGADSVKEAPNAEKVAEIMGSRKAEAEKIAAVGKSTEEDRAARRAAEMARLRAEAEEARKSKPAAPTSVEQIFQVAPAAAPAPAAASDSSDVDAEARRRGREEAQKAKVEDAMQKAKEREMRQREKRKQQEREMEERNRKAGKSALVGPGNFFVFLFGRAFGIAALGAATLAAKAALDSGSVEAEGITGELSSFWGSVANPPVAAASLAGAVFAIGFVDYIASLPVLNLLIAPAFQILGLASVGILAIRFVKDSQNPADTIVEAGKKVAKVLPGVDSK